MPRSKCLNWGSLILLLIVCLLMTGVSCGGSAPAEPVVVEKEVIKEVEKPVVVEKEVVREVEKEVVKEVVVAVTSEPSQAAVIPEWVKQGKQGGGIIPMAICCDLDHWDLHQSCCANGIAAAGKLFNLLVEYNPVGEEHEIIGDLARTWEVLPDGKTYVYHLNEATWTDGTPVTAEDVKFSLDRMIEPGAPRPRVGLLRPYIDTVDVIDQSTVRVSLKFPSPAYLQFQAVDYMVIMPKHIVADPPDGEGLDIDKPKNVVGSGPYVFDDWQKGTSYRVLRNADYFKEGRPFFDGAETFMMKGKGTLVAAFKTEQVLMTGFGSIVLSVKETLDFENELRDSVNVNWLPPVLIPGLFFNFTRPPFDDPNVRRAIFLAIDRQEIMEAIDSGKGALGTPFQPVSGWGSSQEVAAAWPGYRQPKTEDIVEAKRLLAEAGYADGFSAALNAINQPVYVAVTSLIKQQLKELDIDVDLQYFDAPTSLAAYAEGDYEMAFIRHGINITDPDELFSSIYLPGGSRNQLGYEDPRIRELFEKQTKEIDPLKRKVLLLEAEEILRQGEGHWVNLWWSSSLSYPVNKKIKNFWTPPTIQLMYKHEHEWLEE